MIVRKASPTVDAGLARVGVDDPGRDERVTAAIPDAARERALDDRVARAVHRLRDRLALGIDEAVRPTRHRRTDERAAHRLQLAGVADEHAKLATPDRQTIDRLRDSRDPRVRHAHRADFGEHGQRTRSHAVIARELLDVLARRRGELALGLEHARHTSQVSRGRDGNAIIEQRAAARARDQTQRRECAKRPHRSLR